MSAVADKTILCSLDSIMPSAGVAAIINGKQVALFRVDDQVYALDNHDPFSRVSILAQGIIGSTGERLFVASPIYKQRFDLRTGECLDDETVTLTTYPVEVVDGNVVYAA